MPLSMTPGSSIIASPELRCRHGLRRDLSSAALPILPQSVSRGAHISGLPDSRICYGLPSCSPPLYGSDRCTRPPRASTSRLPTDRSPSPLPDISTTATGLLCWRDSHPLEWQLASLHDQSRAAAEQEIAAPETAAIPHHQIAAAIIGSHRRNQRSARVASTGPPAHDQGFRQ